MDEIKTGAGEDMLPEEENTALFAEAPEHENDTVSAPAIEYVESEEILASIEDSAEEIGEKSAAEPINKIPNDSEESQVHDEKTFDIFNESDEQPVKEDIVEDNEIEDDSDIEQISEEDAVQAAYDRAYIQRRREERDIQIAIKRKIKRTLVIFLTIMFLIFGGGFALNFVFTPENTADSFIAALRDGDYKALSRLAYIEGEHTLTEKNIAPMIALYAESEAFRSEINKCLLDDARSLRGRELPSSEGIVNLTSNNFGLFKTFKVQISTPDVSVYTNFRDAKVTISDSTKITHPTNGFNYNASGYSVLDDYYDQTNAKAVFSNLLPGKYTVTATYRSSLGETFKAETVFDLGRNSEIFLDIQFETVEVVNSTEFNMTVFAEEQEIMSLSPGEMFKLLPLNSGDIITVICDAGDTKISHTLTAGEDSISELRFSGLTVDNAENGIPVDIYVNGELNRTAEPYQADCKIYPLKAGDKIDIVPQDSEFIFLLKPIEFEIGSEDETIKVEFILYDELFDGADEVVKKDIEDSFELINKHLTSLELDAIFGQYTTLDNLREYTNHETSGMYSTLSDPEISIDITADKSAYFPDSEFVRICVNATLKYSVGYHEKGKKPTEMIEKESVIEYLLSYDNGNWVIK